jgi:hypothetical protein
MKRYQNYLSYSIACFVVWGIIFLLRGAYHLDQSGDHTVLLVFYGWLIGWGGATIARWLWKDK